MAGAAEQKCPNCDGILTNYRSEKQRAGEREVWLQWLICPYCFHVALQNWAFDDDIGSKQHVAREPVDSRWRTLHRVAR